MDTKNVTNEMIAGKHRAEMMMLPMETRVDRTAAIIAVAKAVAIEKEIPMAIFSLELSNTRLVAHLLADSAEYDVVKALDSKHANGQLQQVLDSVKNKPLYMDDSPSLSAGELKEKAAKLVKEHNVQVILVDHAELMEACEPADLNAIAQELGILLIVLTRKSN